MQIDKNSETYKKLAKMNTDRLIDVFVKKFNAFPNTFDRAVIFAAIIEKLNEELQERLANRINDEVAIEQRNNKIIFDMFKNRTEGKKIGNNLTEGDVKSIRSLHEDGLSFAKIGEMYNKQPNYIRNICIRKLYKNVK